MSTRVFKLKARLLRTDAKTPVPNKTIKFYYRTPTGTYVPFGNPKTTDGDGYATSDGISLTDQEYYFKAVFDGDENYEASSVEVHYTPTAGMFDFSQIMSFMMLFLMIFLFFMMTRMFSE